MARPARNVTPIISAADQHRGWLELVDTEGPFLAIPPLKRVWPQGMPNLSDEHKAALVDVRKDKLEFLAGQSWSMLTPNRKGISALPGDIFISQVVDTNYMAGLTW